MPFPPRHHWPAFLLVMLLLPACDKSPAPTGPAADARPEPAAAAAAEPFEEAQAFFELNTTDHDMGFQVFLDAEGWRWVNLLDPEGNTVFGIHAESGLKEIGITELRFESEEPSPSELRPLFPAGQYTMRGMTVEGVPLQSVVHVSKSMLAAPTFTPRDGQLVDPRFAVVRWDAPGADQVEVIIEQDQLGHSLDVILSGTTTRLSIPRQFLRQGTEYKIEVLAVAENGNRTIAESTFRTRTL